MYFLLKKRKAYEEAWGEGIEQDREGEALWLRLL